MEKTLLVLHHWAYALFLRPAKLLYWHLFRPKARGTKCLILNREKCVLVQTTYGHGRWSFPGGGVKHKESPADANHREVLEEVGINLTHSNFIGTYFSQRYGKRDTVYCYVSHIGDAKLTIDPKEIARAAWFPVDSLPEPRSPSVAKVIDLWRMREN